MAHSVERKKPKFVRHSNPGKVTPYRLSDILNIPSSGKHIHARADLNTLKQEYMELQRIFKFDQRPSFLKLTKDGETVAWDVESPEDRFIVTGTVVEPRVRDGRLTLNIKRRFEGAMILDFAAHYVYYVETVNGDVLDPFLQTLQQAKDVVHQLFSAIKIIDVLDNKIFKANRIQFGLRAGNIGAAFVMLSGTEVLVLSKHKPLQIKILSEKITEYYAENPDELTSE
jgi:hypothetical protein